jgi:hypothetical protein
MFKGTSDYEEYYRKKILVAMVLEKSRGIPAERGPGVHGDCNSDTP